MKSAGKARNNGLYRHIRTSKEIIRNLLNDLFNYFEKSSMFSKTFKDVLLRFFINRDSITSIFYYAAAVFFPRRHAA